MTDGATADVRLGDLLHLDGGLHPRGDLLRLQGGLQRQTVDHGGQHAHVVRGRLFDAMVRGVGAADEVAAADDDSDFDAAVVQLLDLQGHVTRVRRGDAEGLVAQHRFAAELQKDPAIFGLDGS